MKILWTEFALTELKSIFDYYKIIYRISSKQIYITDIFDCRRNPNTIKENNQ